MSGEHLCGDGERNGPCDACTMNSIAIHDGDADVDALAEAQADASSRCL